MKKESKKKFYDSKRKSENILDIGMKKDKR